MLLSRCEECETSSCKGLDAQLLYQINLTQPKLLVKIDDIPNVILGSSVHPWVQSAMKSCLIRATAKRPGVNMTINSAYRTIVGQQLLRSHMENGRCDIANAARPGRSNHNNASAIDIEDAYDWQDALESSGFNKLGNFDPMHYDCVECIDMRSISTLAFQQIWNMANPQDKLALDGDFGQLVASRLRNAPIEGFANLPAGYPQRLLKFTEPLQAGNDVGKLQLSLRAAGIDIGRADKIFGEGLDKALRAYQTKMGMVADGVAGKATLLALSKPFVADVA